ncbi:AEC family transporter [Salsuginibacillus kocurii]|uniref:AEC family transporter n=1 Tax=Salsuginibacillus kocurii TaxID=427078 RepID=UPI000363B8F4|nr:AEC family transporter [Salsuginibacillus kocurii]
MEIFLEVMVPVLLVFVTGYILQKRKMLDIKPVSTVALYVMTPALVFDTFYDTTIDIQYMYMLIFSAILLAVLIVINKVYAMIRKFSQDTESGLILSTAFMNAGNFGAPLILFAYGEEGFAYAVSFMVIQSVIMNVFGVYYAARGGSGIRQALKTVLMMPVTWAVVAAMLVIGFNITVPAPLLLTTGIIGEAAIPTVMIILGMQLALIPWRSFEWELVTFSTLVRLFISPLLAFGITLLMPMDPMLANVLIVSAAMPSAATIVMYSVQFEARPELVSSVTLITTVISVVTITMLLFLLGS